MARDSRKSNGILNGNGIQKSEETKRKNWMDIKTVFVAKNEKQKEVLRTINNNTVTIISGLAGTGKTFLAVMYGLNEFLKGKYKRLIFTRPCVEAVGEKLGYLPGGFNEKISPYMIPIFCVLEKAIGVERVNKLIEENCIVTLPLAFQRGVTFEDAFVLLDEAQNTIPNQIEMFLTRIGDNSKIVITGDPSQSDIDGINGLVDACERLKGVSGLAVVTMEKEHIVRHPIVALISQKYERK